jgi:hypothetical protein
VNREADTERDDRKDRKHDKQKHLQLLSIYNVRGRSEVAIQPFGNERQPHHRPANLDGTSVKQDFITAAYANGVAVQSGFIYWGTVAGSDGTTKTIGRANLNGTGVNTHFITGASNPGMVTVDAKHIYWANAGPVLSGTTIGRANLNGAGANEHFVRAPGVCGIAVDRSHIYWTSGLNPTLNTIGRSNLNGTAVNQHFLTGTGGPCGVAVG